MNALVIYANKVLKQQAGEDTYDVFYPCDPGRHALELHQTSVPILRVKWKGNKIWINVREVGPIHPESATEWTEEQILNWITASIAELRNSSQKTLATTDSNQPLPQLPHGTRRQLDLKQDKQPSEDWVNTGLGMEVD